MNMIKYNNETFAYLRKPLLPLKSQRAKLFHRNKFSNFN